MTDAPVRPAAEIYLIRHGETDWNRDGRFQGRRDIPLNGVGKDQARHAGRKLKRLIGPGEITTLDIISSPLLRARQSAREICRTLGWDDRRVRVSNTLAELSFGAWEGLTTEQVRTIYPEHRRARRLDRWNVAAPGGESFRDRIPDLRTFLIEINRPTALVCHAGVIRVCLYLLGVAGPESALTRPISHHQIYVWSEGTLAAR